MSDRVALDDRQKAQNKLSLLCVVALGLAMTGLLLTALPSTAKAQGGGGINPMGALANPTNPGRTGPPEFSATRFEAGHVAWMALCALGVLLLVPGWLLFYGGWRRLDQLPLRASSIALCTAWLVLAWGLVFHSFAFGFNWGARNLAGRHLSGPDGTFSGSPVIGDAGHVAFGVIEPQVAGEDYEFPLRRRNDRVPHISLLLFQLVTFVAAPVPLLVLAAARLRPALVTAAAIAWGGLVYVPAAHWIWGSGWLRQMGAVDFGGGLIHVVVGFSALGLALTSRRSAEAPVEGVPEQPGVLLAGGALTILGLLFLNAGGAGSAAPAIAFALLNALLAAAAGAIVWVGTEWLRGRQGGVRQAVPGMLSGLIGISAASGLVAPQSAIVIGLVAAAFARGAVASLAERPAGSLLAVFGLQGVGGALGLLAAGLFASANIAGVDSSGRPVDGLLAGNLQLIQSQGLALLAIAGLALVGSSAIGLLLRFVPDHSEAPAISASEQPPVSSSATITP